MGAGPPSTRLALVSRHFPGLREPAVLPHSCTREAPTLAYYSFIKTIITSEIIDSLEGHQPAVVGLIRIYYLLNHLIQTKKKSLIAQKVMSVSVKTLY